MIPNNMLDLLLQRFPDHISHGAHDLAQHSHDESPHAPQHPLAVYYASSTEDVSQVAAFCHQHHLPMSIFGAGTSVEGQSIPAEGALCIDLSRMNRVIAINTNDQDCRVEAGITRLTLNDHLTPHGLFFPVDPGADASIGGMCATRASGTNAVKYGTMKHNVLGLTAVTATGQIIHTGGRSRKSSAGYDLTSLLLGSEGTLAIITEVTLKLYGLPENSAVAFVQFDQLSALIDLVIATLQLGIPIARIELLDSQGIHAVNQYSELQLPEKHTLFLEFQGSLAAIEEQTQQVRSVALSLGGTEFEWAIHQEDKNRLWQARHNVLYAAKALVPNCDVLTTDVCVPIGNLAACILDTHQDILAANLLSPIVGHVGDGNFHLLMVIPPDDPEASTRTHSINERLVQRALHYDGTSTGEHGIGKGKKHWLEPEHGAAVEVMKTIKAALDPQNLLGRGNIF